MGGFRVVTKAYHLEVLSPPFLGGFGLTECHDSLTPLIPFGEGAEMKLPGYDFSFRMVRYRFVRFTVVSVVI